MSKKVTFVPSSKVITIASGKVDWFKSTEEFRTRVQNWALVQSELADQSAMHGDEIRRLRESLEHYSNPNLVAINPEYIEERKKALPVEIAREEAVLNAIKEELSKRKPEVSEMDKALYDAYKNAYEGKYTEAQSHFYTRAFSEWLDNAGVVPAEKTISYLMKQFGGRAVKGKKLIKNGGTEFVGAITQKTFLDILYGAIATDMVKVGAVKPYKFNYKFPEKNSK